jgi:[1-hydroxy-2-(trimethylamino)ethyl]phosphonate dioxygenase
MTETPLAPDTIVTFIADIFLRRGADSYLGEDVTMSEHMLQGAWLAQQAGAEDALIAAALLHDIGHYTNEFPEDALDRGINNHHDSAGAAVLEHWFPKIVVDCVRQHVAAKRYLCATDPTYLDRLSDASVHTLNLQGGPMNDIEAAAFQKQENLAAIIQVRQWDEAGKIAGARTPEFEQFMPLLQRLVDNHCGIQGNHN